MKDCVKYLTEYIEEWHKQDIKPCNESEFVKNFIEFMEISGHDHYTFEGDNDYFGCTAFIREVPEHYDFGVSMVFELAYSKDFVKVFTAKHNGFWTPEYISLSGEDALEILEILEAKSRLWLGFGE